MDQISMQLIIIAGFMLVAYFLLIKPQKKRQKEMFDMRESLKKGDSVVTIGGLKGVVIEVTDKDVIIESSTDKTKIEILKSAIHSITNKLEESVEENKEYTE